jgi:hypothetical protein
MGKIMTNAVIANNPALALNGRSPYELGHLLMSLPADFLVASKISPDAIAMADAAVTHTRIMASTVLNGLESLGEIMGLAGLDPENEIHKSSLSNLGYLIAHLAVEVQFLHETESSFQYSINE